ncbi:MAG: glutaminyl-peptide cyclotransferase, partial [Bacteroidia bacterium]|nr:glutaminyl-peptide cyclotransferase [Bacteroidia bacterium]
MSIIKFACYFFFIVLLTCGEDPDPSKLFTVKIEPKAASYQAGDSIMLKLVNRKGLEVSEVRYSINGTSETSDDNLVLPELSLGNQEIKAQIISGTDTLEIFKKIKILASLAPQIFTYEIVNEYPHDMKAYTQGLEFHGDTLYESTGRKGQSSLRKVDFGSGEVLKKIDLEPNFFGEGLTINGNKIYQLSWQSKIGFIYDLDAFERSGSFQYGKSKEGRGLCHDDTYIYKSDGTEKIWRLDPETLQEID